MPEPAAPLRYAAFISYSHANEAEAARLHRALENFRLPKDIVAPRGLPTSRGRIAPVFRDREELSSSPDLSASIRAALEASSALIVICSPKARASRWVNEEIKLFKRLNGEGRVYALLIEGEPAEAFPPALLKKIGPDGELTETQGEPLAADIRQGKDGWKIGTLKIAAGLLDVGLDALRQREAQRERRRRPRPRGMGALRERCREQAAGTGGARGADGAAHGRLYG
ncbi:MAG: toll/interleukin-1 receptor domain-containing protein [Parvularculaceae bacterium]